MFTRVIIASELSSTAFDTLNCLKGLKNLGVKECLLLQCANPQDTNTITAPFVTTVLSETLAKQKEILTAQGYDVQTRVVRGLMKNEINRIAIEENFSLIVAGATEHSLLGDVMLGGVAHEVIHKAEKPVLLIRIPENPNEELSKIKECNLIEHILFPTDFSENANHAFEYVKMIADNGTKKVTLIHVQDLSRIAPDRLDEFNRIDAARLQELKKTLQAYGSAEIDIKLLQGSPSVELIRVIGEQKISLVVMGSQGRGFVEELFLGSVSHNVARHSSASILLVPAKRIKL